MGELLNINKIWIEYISESPSDDKYCVRLWEELEWEVSYDDSDNYVIKTNYKYGSKGDKIQTWTEPFGTSKRFDRWCYSAKKFLQTKFNKHEIQVEHKREKYNQDIQFKIIKPVNMNNNIKK